MKRARFSEEQITGVLAEAEAGAKVSELSWRHGISDATFYTWRSKYGGLEISEMRRLRELLIEEENRCLKSIVADQALDVWALKNVLAKNGCGPQ
jgi:putative transposase